MTLDYAILSHAPKAPPTDVGAMIEQAVKAAPNKAFVQAQLSNLTEVSRLVRFLHRFLLFNDALAARVPYLAGLIHLTPDLFVDQGECGSFSSQRNALIAAHVAEAAHDEYRMTSGRNMVHQHLSQVFFSSVLAHYDIDAARFEIENPTSSALKALLREARSRFFVERCPEDLFAALGFHVGLEFFANEEFNDVDNFLTREHAALVNALKVEGPNAPPYTWLAVHCVVEVGHYNAAHEAVRSAVAFCNPRGDAARMANQIIQGLEAFAELQMRFYTLALAEGA